MTEITHLNPIPELEKVGTRITEPVKEGPPDLIPGLLPARGQLVIAGETDIGKTLVALEICSTLTTGNPLWGELYATKEIKRVVYILGEHYNEVLQRLWAKTLLPMTDEVWLIGPEQLGYDKWLVAQGKPNLIAVEKLIRWCKDADLIVFDPLAAFVTGIDAENDNVQMRLVLDTMSLITQAVGASCLILAHQGKPMMDKFGVEHNRKSYAIRGASAVEDAATNIFYMGKADGVSEAAASTRDNKILSLKRRKYKGTAPDEYRLVRDKNTLVHTLLGNRPFIEVRKMEIQAKLARLQTAFPQMKNGQAINVLASVEGLSDDTIRRYLVGT